MQTDATLSFSIKKNNLIIFLSGNFVQYENEKALHSLWSKIRTTPPQQIFFHTEELKTWDSSLVVILYKLIQQAQKQSIQVNLSGLPSGLQRLLGLAFTVERKAPRPLSNSLDFISRIGETVLMIIDSVQKGSAFLKEVVISFGRAIAGITVMRKVDFWFALDDCGPKALGIVSLISFMIGLILAFVGAIQLKTFGAQIYVASLVAIGMTRIMGAIMVGVIMAGRTGASYAATIGTMQVNEELDALKTMGIPASDFLILPRIMALVLIMPLLTMWADIMGIIGGATVGVFMLDLSIQEYWNYSVRAFTLKNFLVGIFHGLVFGCVIALCGCYYGLTAARNANGVGVATTKAVVSAIVWMIFMTGLITWFFGVIGI